MPDTIPASDDSFDAGVGETVRRRARPDAPTSTPKPEGGLPPEPTFTRQIGWATHVMCSRCGAGLGVEGRAIPHTLRDCFDRMASDVQDLKWWRESMQEALR